MAYAIAVTAVLARELTPSSPTIPTPNVVALSPRGHRSRSSTSLHTYVPRIYITKFTVEELIKFVLQEYMRKRLTKDRARTFEWTAASPQRHVSSRWAMVQIDARHQHTHTHAPDQHFHFPPARKLAHSQSVEKARGFSCHPLGQIRLCGWSTLCALSRASEGGARRLCC
ncbi:hypothetical protein B0H34DRAFT_702181 [Crassisporium funariophilum]|nr:hypothetical protein B0H34DRAFT_702181 [Crassisporium funariophilum]